MGKLSDAVAARRAETELKLELRAKRADAGRAERAARADEARRRRANRAERRRALRGQIAGKGCEAAGDRAHQGAGAPGGQTVAGVCDAGTPSGHVLVRRCALDQPGRRHATLSVANGWTS